MSSLFVIILFARFRRISHWTEQHHYSVLGSLHTHPFANTTLEKIRAWGMSGWLISPHLSLMIFLRVVGLGGLGHMAVKFGTAMGAHVTVISTSESKRDDATKLGAKAFIVSKDEKQLKDAKSSLDFIIDTVSAPHDVAAMIDLLGFEGTICMYVGYCISMPTRWYLRSSGSAHHRNRWKSVRCSFWASDLWSLEVWSVVWRKRRRCWTSVASIISPRTSRTSRQRLIPSRRRLIVHWNQMWNIASFSICWMLLNKRTISPFALDKKTAYTVSYMDIIHFRIGFSEQECSCFRSFEACSGTFSK